MTTLEERRAADARRAAAEQAAEHDGGDDAAFMRQRTSVAGLTRARRVSMPSELRGSREPGPSGKMMYHTSGYFTRYARGYPMWDDFGRYVEMTMPGSGAATLAARPDVCFLTNHLGVAMARTKSGSLILSEDNVGGRHEAWLNLERQDVNDLAAAIDDGTIDEMSFAFMIPKDMGVWSEDFTTFEIRAYDIDRGDVSAVNYGANPYTDIAGAAEEMLRSLDKLPDGARREAAARLGVEERSGQVAARERIQVKMTGVDRTASPHVRMLQWRRANTARRYAELMDAAGISAAEAMNVALPWYEIRAAAGPFGDDEQDDSLIGEQTSDATDILIYDEIGGSFGTTADQFAADIASIETPNINLRINSPGGSVFDALAIASSIRHARDNGKHVTAYIDGMAASAASVIAISADEVVSMPGAQFMIHKASSTIDGNDEVATKMAAFLLKQSKNIADQYAAKAGGDPADWMQMMTDETWFTPSEAVDAGLADRVWNSGNKRAGERAASDPRLTRSWESLPYRYVNRAGAPVTQQRRSLPTAEPFTPPFADMGRKVDEIVGVEPENSGSTPERPKGRSIALIEAIFASEGADLAE